MKSKANGSGGYLPVFFDVRGRRVVVVGAGTVAARRIRSLLSRGASVTVVAPAFSAAVAAHADRGELAAIREPFRPAHLDGMTLAFAAASDPRVNALVAHAARARNIPVNAADDPGACSFIMPAVVENDGFTLAVSTGGRNPGAARAIREFLEERREEIGVRIERGRRRNGAAGRKGTVYIVGAGPGDPDLLTVRALGLLRSADAVVHDYLVPEAILSLAPARAAKVCFARKGRTAGHGAALKQAAIHAAMVRLARDGKSVVRLKSGDPFVFGRGGEEAEALAREGVPFEIVPGITAAVGCAAAAKIPLTRRGLSSSITLVAGHEADGKTGGGVDWSRVPKTGTVAVYMGVARTQNLAKALLSGGWAPDTPFAAVENGTTAGQRVVRGSLAEMPRLAREAGLRSPAVLFVGASAAPPFWEQMSDAQETEDGSFPQSV